MLSEVRFQNVKDVKRSFSPVPRRHDLIATHFTIGTTAQKQVLSLS